MHARRSQNFNRAFVVSAVLFAMVAVAFGQTAPGMSRALAAVGGLEITASGGMAPAVVHVDVVKAVWNRVDPKSKFLADRSLRYDWMFGDPKSKYDWLPGWHAAHLYEQPGTYQITLIVSDATGVRKFTLPITIKPDARLPVHIHDTTGLINAMGASNAHLYLQRGMKYGIGRTLPFGVLNTIIDAEGEGDPPDIHILGKIGLLQYVDTETRNTIIRDIRFTSEGPSYDNIEYGDGWMGWVRGVNNALVNCEFDKTQQGIQTHFNSFFPFLQDNRQLNKYGIVDHFMWIEGHYTVELGNHGLGSLWENVRRTAADGIERGLVYRDIMEHADGLPKRYPYKATYTFRTAKDLYIFGCVAKGSWFGFEPRSDARVVNNVVVEDCTMDNAQFTVRPGVHNIEFRFNKSGPILPSGPAMSIMFSHGTSILATGITVHDNFAALTHQRKYAEFFEISGDPTPEMYQSWENEVDAPDGSHTLQRFNR